MTPTITQTAIIDGPVIGIFHWIRFGTVLNIYIQIGCKTAVCRTTGKTLLSCY